MESLPLRGAIKAMIVTVVASAAFSASAAAEGAGANSFYPSNRPPLPSSAFSMLPLGAIKPQGWLKKQLRIQADGLSGHLPEFWPDLGPNSGWLGGTGEAWERGPYYMDGLIPLAFLTEDPKLIESAKKWVGWTLDNQGEDGWLGPRRNQDWWPLGVMLKVLTQYQEATGDPRVIPAMQRFFRYMQVELPNRPLKDWAQVRWADTVLSILWLYNRTGDRSLLDLARLLQQQGYDWAKHFSDLPYKERVTSGFSHPTHVVNNAMGIKTPAVMYEITGDHKYRDAAYKAIPELDKYHGQPSGVFAGDEHFAGLSPSQGTELCAVVEYMFSLENLVALFGDVPFADRLERIAYNALPATFSPDMWAHQYDQQANQVMCRIAQDRPFATNGPDANIFGLEPNFGCCTANFSQGWPKLVSHLWMATPDDGLAAIAYAPCTVTAKVRGGHVATIDVQTEYPFDGDVKMVVKLDAPATFPIKLRIPEWADGAALRCGGETYDARPGQFATIERLWHSGDAVELTLPMRIRVERRYNDAATVVRGPLVFSLRVGEAWRKVRGQEPHADYEVYPTAQWNYALALDERDPAKSFYVVKKAMGDSLFSPTGSPIELRAKGRLLPEWTLEHNAAAPPPKSPVKSDQPLVELTFVPYGCAKLRVTEIPVLGSD